MPTPVPDHLLLVGSYAPHGTAGVHLLDAADPRAGLHVRSISAVVASPSWLTVHPGAAVVYAVSEVDSVGGGGEVVALRLEPGGAPPTELCRVSSTGPSPCHLAVDAAGHHLHAANYGDGSVATWVLDDDGAIGPLRSRHQHAGSGPVADRQAGPHAHGVLPSGAGRLLATDLGTDQLVRYRPAGDEGGLVLDEVLQLPAGTGPRHAALVPGGTHAVVVGELDHTLGLVEVADEGPLRLLSVTSLHPGGAPPTGWLSAAVVVDPVRLLVHVSTRGADTVTTLRLDGERPPVVVHETPSGGRTPRDLTLHPDGQHLVVANQESDEVSVLALDADGLPGPVVTRRRVKAPTSVTFTSGASPPLG